MKNFVVLLGTNNVQINCSINITNSIGPLFNALQVSWLLNGTEQLSNTPSDDTEHTDSFTSTLTVDITGYDKTGNYCCIASLAGSDGDMADCLNVTVSGTFVCCCMMITKYCICMYVYILFRNINIRRLFQSPSGQYNTNHMLCARNTTRGSAVE